MHLRHLRSVHRLSRYLYECHLLFARLFSFSRTNRIDRSTSATFHTRLTPHMIYSLLYCTRNSLEFAGRPLASGGGGASGMTLGETLQSVIADNLSLYSCVSTASCTGGHMGNNHQAGTGSMPPPCSVAGASSSTGLQAAALSHRRKEPSISGALSAALPPSGTPNNSGTPTVHTRCTGTGTGTAYTYCTLVRLRDCVDLSTSVVKRIYH